MTNLDKNQIARNRAKKETSEIKKETNLTEVQLKGTGLPQYAVFLPATSGFYATFIGKQRYGNYVDPARVPSQWKHGVEGLNYLDPNKSEFYYKWCLYSAGHANLDLNKPSENEDMFRNRDRNTSIVVGDSGGFQIAKFKWQANWKDPTCPAALKKRQQVLTWMDSLMDYGMTLDVPAWITRSPDSKQYSGIETYTDALNATFINNEYFIRNRNGNCKFLNVLQGENHADADNWYQNMKKYCDPKIYPDAHFNGWSMGGQNMCDIHLMLKRLISLRFDGLLEKGKHDWMHFLGTSKLEWACLLTDVQNAVRKYHNSNFTISFDCASPFLATANGQIYIQTEIEDRSKWVYRMVPSVDDKKYSKDTRLFKDAVIQDKIFKHFESSPLMDTVKINDVCIYGPGDVNKIGREGKTSWDSFSYAIQMGHNVWAHVTAVQRANILYEKGIVPNMLVQETFDRLFFKDIVYAILETSNRGKAEQLVEEYNRFWMSIIGTRGATGKKTVNSSTYFSALFEEETKEIAHSEEFTEDEINKLEELEDES